MELVLGHCLGAHRYLLVDHWENTFRFYSFLLLKPTLNFTTLRRADLDTKKPANMISSFPSS